MLQSIRDRTQNWLMGVIIFLACAAFALWGVHSYIGSSATPDVVATVNHYSVHQTELNQAYERLRQQEQMQMGADFVLDPATEIELKKQALNQLIMGRVLTEAARKDGYRVTMDQVRSALLMIPAFQANGEFSRDRFNEVLSSMLYTEQQFLADLQMTMLTAQVRSGFITSEFALPDEVATAIRLVNQKRDIAYSIIPTSRFLSNATISDADALNFYNAHQAQFTAPEQVSLEYIELSLPQIAAQQHFDDAELQQFYQNNLNNYTTPERWHVARILIKTKPSANAQQIAAAQAEASDILQRIKSGEDFAKLAKTYSDDKTSGDNGGLMDWFGPGMVDPVIEKAVAALTKPGDVTTPIQTKEGFNIIKLVEVQKPQVQPFEKVKAQVEKAMAQQKAEHLFADASDKLSNLTYANPNSLDVAAKTLGLTVKTSGFITRQGGKDTITSNPKVFKVAFSTDVLNGNNSDVIELDPDTLLVLRVKQHKAAYLQPFNAVRDDVIATLKTQKAQQQAEALSQQIVQQVQQSNDINTFAHHNNLSLQTANSIARFGSSVPVTLTTAAFRMPKPEAPAKFTATSVKMPNGDYAVLILTGVHEGSIASKAADTQQRVYREQLENSFGQLSYALYARGLEKKAKVVINNKPAADDKTS